MQKYWAWLGLNLGKRAGVVSIVGLVVTIVLGAGITQLEFATGQDSYLNKDEEIYKDSVAYQDLFGGQAMVTLVTLGEGQTLADLFTPEAVETWERVEAELKERGGDQIFAVVTPLTALQLHQRPRAPDPRGTSLDGVAAQILLGATERDPTEEGKAARERQLAGDPRAGERDPAGRPRDRQRGVERLPPPRQRGRDPQVAAAVLPERDERPDGRAAPRQPRHRDRGRGRHGGGGRHRRPRVRRRHRQHHRCRGAAPRPQRLPHRRHARARRHRRRAHGDHPPGRLRRALAAASARRRADRLRLGVRPGRLPRHPAHRRHHRRPAGDARRGHRLRDPDARARRGGGGDRPRRAPDPGDRDEPRPGAARRHLRRHLRLPRAALRQGADDPRLRPAARRRRRRDLPVQHHRPARRARHPRVQVAHAPARTSARASSAASW